METKTRRINQKQKLIVAKVINQIIQQPNCWDQSTWHNDCGTAHCFAGLVELKVHGAPSNFTAKRVTKFLDLGDTEAGWLFSSDRWFNQLYWWAEAYIKRDDLVGERGLARILS